jgi:hypothetical protein
MAINALHTDSLISDRLIDAAFMLPNGGRGFLRMIKKPSRVFSMHELNPDRLQNPAIVDMMRHPPLDESGFGLES